MVSLTEGQRIRIEGLVTRSMYGRALYEINDGSLAYNISTKERLALGDVIHCEGVIESISEPHVICDRAEVLAAPEAKEKADIIKKKMLGAMSVRESGLFVKDEITEKLKPKFIELAKYLMLAKRLGRSILLRFHSDADGISAAFALTRFLRCRAEQQNAAIYHARDAIRDLNALSYEYAPLAVFVDFGASEESTEALKLLKAGGVELVIIDHHPPADGIEEIVDVFLSPWQVSNEASASQYAAGYLACEIAGAACNENEELEELARISCAGDKSRIMQITETDISKALVLDFLAVYSGYGNNLDFYRNVLANEELFMSVLQQAKDKMSQISGAAMKTAKKYNIGELALYVLELDQIIKEHEFPSRGKIVTMISENLGNECAIIVLGYGKKTIIIRLNQMAADAGYSAEHMISELKISMKDFIESGGGHAKAAAIRTHEGYAKSVCDALVEAIK